MTKQQFEKFKEWFYGYVASFYGDDALANDNIKLKEDHTRRMCVDTIIIADELGLNDEQKMIAETISLLHDVGRFEQFKKYRSYNDVGTENHSLLGLKVLTDKKILECLDEKERNIIKTAIRLHGEKDLPKGLEGEMGFFARLIRDIDKLDIYYVMVSRVGDFRRNAEESAATLGFSQKEGYSKDVIRAVMENRTINYKDIKSINDMIIMMLGWVVDVNFVPVLKEIKKRKLFEQMIAVLPDTEDIHRAAQHVLEELNARILKG